MQKPVALTDQALEAVVSRLDGHGGDATIPLRMLVGLLPQDEAVCELLKLASIDKEPYAQELQQSLIQAGAVVGLLAAAVGGSPDVQRLAKLALSAIGARRRRAAAPLSGFPELRPIATGRGCSEVANLEAVQPTMSPISTPPGTPSTASRCTSCGTPVAATNDSKPAAKDDRVGALSEKIRRRAVAKLRDIEAAFDPSAWSSSPTGMRSPHLKHMRFPRWARLGGS